MLNKYDGMIWLTLIKEEQLAAVSSQIEERMPFSPFLAIACFGSKEGRKYIKNTIKKCREQCDAVENVLDTLEEQDAKNDQ